MGGTPRMHFTIIEAGPNDVGDVALLFDAYRVFYDQQSDLAGARAFVGERVQKGDSVIYLARSKTDKERTPLGFVQLYPSYSSVSMRRLWVLNDLFIDERGRQRGVGRALMDRALQLAHETGAKGLILETAIDNHPARALYESYGFVKDTEFYRYSLDVGRRG